MNVRELRELGVLEREAGYGDFSEDGVGNRADHLTRLEIRVRQDIGDGHDGSGWNPMVFKDLQDSLIIRLSLHPTFDNRNECGLVLPALGICRKARVFDQFRSAHSLAHIGPLSV